MNKKRYKNIKKYKKKRLGFINTKNIIITFFVLLIFVTIGYSYWNTTLHINGTVTAIGNFLTTYNITYDLDGGSFYETPISSYTEETPTFDLPTPVKEGYRFVGWTDGTTQSQQVLQNSIEMELNKVYQIGTQGNNTLYIRTTSGQVMTCFVTYQGKPRCMIYAYNTNVTTQYSTNGTTFNTVTLGNKSTTTADGVLIYYDFYTLSEGGQNTASGIPTYNGSFEDFTAAIVETEEYVYSNPWTVELGSTGNIDVMALWEAATTYKVTFNANTGTGNMPDQIIVSGESETLLPNAFTKENYTFAGWATSSGGSVVYTDEQSITPNSNLNLYAKWSTPITVTFHSNGGTGMMSSQTFASGVAQKLDQNLFTYSGADFIGWSTSSGGAIVYEDEESITINSDTDLYANWGYTIIFNNNGGTGTMSNLTYSMGETKALTTNTFTRNGYVFRGWATSSSATTADYQDGESITPTQSMTLYAVWKQTFTVTLYRNQRTNDRTTTTITVVEDEEYVFTTAPFTRNGYTLSGWATSRNGTAIYSGSAINTSSNPITSNRSLYAKWTSN